MRLADFYVFCFLLGLSLSGLVGCKSLKVAGGTASHNQGEFEFAYDLAGGGQIKVTDSRDRVSSTQPSVEVQGSSAMPRTTATTQPGDIGGLSFDLPPIIRKTFADRYAWALATVFLVCAGFCYWTHKYVYMVACIAIGVLSALNPTALMIGAIVVLAGTLFLWVKDLQQSKAAIAFAAANNPENPEDAKGYMREKLDNSTQKSLGVFKKGPK